MSQINVPKGKTTLIYNGLDSRKFSYRNRIHGFKLAYLGGIKYEKAIEMLLQILKKLVEIDRRYKLYLAGEVYKKEIEVYFNYMLQEMELENNVIYDGFQINVDQWLEDKDYIICSSIVEGHITAIQEAMLKGIKPIIHNYPGAKELYGPQHLWNTIDEAVELITKGSYNSKEYQDMIHDQFELLHKAEEFKKLFKHYLEEYS
jgi:glycosyltransferase involved in cell wall biosynthesis